ncbi:MAG: hypothetical protein ACREPR_09405 [Brasilonema sp.]
MPAASVFIYSSRDFVWHYRERDSEYINLMLDQKLLGQIAAQNGLSPQVELEHRIIFPDPTIRHLVKNANTTLKLDLSHRTPTSNLSQFQRKNKGLRQLLIDNQEKITS